MRSPSHMRVLPLVAVKSLSLVLVGCASGVPAGAPMMGDPAGVRYAPSVCAAPDALRGTVVQVRLADMGMTRMMGGTAPMGARMTLTSSPVAVAAGAVTFVVSNSGWRTHEFLVLPLAGEAGQRSPETGGEVSESGILAEVSRTCGADSGTGLTSGSVGWTTVTLAAGRYELVCNLPNHYVDGMHQQFTVT